MSRKWILVGVAVVALSFVAGGAALAASETGEYDSPEQSLREAAGPVVSVSVLDDAKIQGRSRLRDGSCLLPTSVVGVAVEDVSVLDDAKIQGRSRLRDGSCLLPTSVVGVAVEDVSVLDDAKIQGRSRLRDGSCL